MSTLKERINEYLAHTPTAHKSRESGVAIPEFEETTYWKDIEKVDQQYEQESLEMLKKHF